MSLAAATAGESVRKHCRPAVAGMGCAASTGASAPSAGAGAPASRGKTKDIQGTYRERLGEDFMRDFARSHDTIRRRMSEPRAGGSPEGSQASAASTLPLDDVRYLTAAGTKVSPYRTPPKGSLPAPADHEDIGPSSGPLSGCSMPKDADGPYMYSGKNSRSVSREGSRERLEGQRRLTGLAGMQRNVPHRLQPLTHQGPMQPLTHQGPAPDGPLFV